MTQLQRRHTEVSEEFQRYVKLARKTDSEHFGHEMQASAEGVAKQKHELEQEIEKVKIDITYRGRVVADEKVIANGLLTFEQTAHALSFEDQRQLLELLLRQVRINRLDSEKDSIPADSETLGTQIRTQWYAVKFKFYATDLISKTYGNATLSSIESKWR